VFIFDPENFSEPLSASRPLTRGSSLLPLRPLVDRLITDLSLFVYQELNDL